MIIKYILLTTHFERLCYRSQRSLHLYDTETMQKIAEEDLGDSPSVLSLYYDECTSVLYATGKVGLSFIFVY